MLNNNHLAGLLTQTQETFGLWLRVTDHFDCRSQLLLAQRQSSALLGVSATLLCGVQETLYSEDLSARAAAVSLISAGYFDSANFTRLLERPALLSITTRLLREDGRKSIDVSLAAVGLFCALSCFTQLHSNLLENQAGARTLELLSFTLQRIRLQVRVLSCIYSMGSCSLAPPSDVCIYDY